MADGNFDLVLDFVAPHNRNVRFWPAAEVFRGEARMSELTGENPNGAMNGCPGQAIPGKRMLVDTKAKMVKVIDKMTLPEYKATDEHLKRLTTNSERYSPHQYNSFDKDQEWTLGLKDWPTWLYWMRRIVDHGRAKVVKGKLPTYEEILKIGRVQLGDSCNVVPEDKTKPFYTLDLEWYTEQTLEEATA